LTKRRAPITGKLRLFEAVRRDDAFAEVTPLPFSDGAVTDADPAIAWDQSFNVFCSGRETPGRLNLFIAFRNPGIWSLPLRLPDSVSGKTRNQDAHLSADDGSGRPAIKGVCTSRQQPQGIRLALDCRALSGLAMTAQSSPCRL
jgi:hypothetical protein